MSVKALARGLKVLRTVNALNPAYVKDVVAETQLPKATVIRLLKSLVEEGYLVVESNGVGYRVSPAARNLSIALGERSRYATASEAVLHRLGLKLKFPSVFSVRDHDALQVEASNRASCPVRLQLTERTRLPLLESAAGMAYLSALTPDESESIIRDLGISESTNPRIDSRTLLQHIEHCRQRGFATRRYPSLQGVIALAIPVYSAGNPIGALSTIYFDDLIHREIFQQTIFPAMSKAAKEINDAVSAPVMSEFDKIMTGAMETANKSPATTTPPIATVGVRQEMTG